MPFDPFALLTNPGMGDASALPMPGDAVSVPAPMPAPAQPIPPQFPVPMQASDLPPVPDAVPMKDRGGIDWLALMKLAAPAIGMLVSRGNGGEGAFMNGWLQGQRLASTESLRKQGEEQKRRTASADYLMKIGENALAIDDPVLFDEFMRLADDAGAQAGYNRPGELRGRLSYPQSKVAALRLKELTDRLDLLEKQGYNLDDLAQSGSSIELKDGKRVPVASALELTQRRPVDAAGAPVPKPKKPIEEGKTVEERGAMILLARDAALAKGDKAEADRLQKQYDAILRAKKEIGQADDKRDPLLDEMRRMRIELMRRQANSPDLSPAQFNMANRLADDFARDSKDFVQRGQSYGTVLAAAKDPSAAGDLSMIFAYMKMLDPGSVVREGEFATAQNAAGVPDRIKNTYNRIVNGERLNPRQRQDFVAQARNIYGASRRRQDAIVKTYTQRAQTAKVPVNLVVIDYGAGVEEPAPAGAAPGPGASARVYYDANGNPIKR